MSKSWEKRQEIISNYPCSEHLQHYFPGQTPEKHSDHVKFLSPFRSEQTPSLALYHGDRGWHDYGSGEGGSIIEFVKLFHKCTFWEAVEYITGEMQTYVKPEHKNESTRKTKPKKKVDISFEKIKRYMDNIGLSQEYIESRQVDIDSALRSYTGARTVTTPLYTKSGKYVTDIDFKQICMPSVVEERVMSVTFRRDEIFCDQWMDENKNHVNTIRNDLLANGISEERITQKYLKDRIFGAKYLKAPGHRHMVYNAHHFVHRVDNTWLFDQVPYVFLLESHMDVLTLQSARYHAIQAKWNNDWFHKMPSLLCNVGHIYIPVQNDEAGIRMASKAREVFGYTRSTFISIPSQFNDINDISIDRGLNGLQSFLSKKPHYIRQTA